MKKGWRKITLRNVARYITTSSPVSRFSIETYISTENMLPDKAGVRIASSVPSKGSATAFNIGDVLVSNIRPYFKKVWAATFQGGCSKDVLVFRAVDGVDKDWLRWVLSQDQFFAHSMLGAKGSKMPRGDKEQILDFGISLPPIPTQRRIAAVLGALADKIELNRKMNATLEEMAQALYKHWFVDFGPWGGKMPNGWRSVTLGDVCRCVLGGTPDRSKSEYWGGDVPWINSGKVNEFRIVSASEYITKEGLEHSATKMLPKKTTVLAITGATLGQYSLLEIDSSANQSVIGVVESETLPYEFVYPFVARSISKLVTHATGGAQQHINKHDVEKLKVIIPPAEMLARYCELATPLFEQVATLCFQSRALAAMRDALLPKLMSGEVEVA